VVPGESVGFDLDVGQIGAKELRDTVLRLRLPEGFTFVSATDGGAVDGAGEVAWNLGTLGVSATRHLSVQASTAPNFGVGRNVQAEARLMFAAERIEALLASQLSVRSTQEAPPITLTLSAPQNSVAPGATASYVATLTNVSTRALTGVSLVVRLPSGLSFNATSGAEPDAACYLGNCGHGEAPWTIANLAAGAVQIITFNPLVASTGVLPGSLLPIPFHLTAVGVEVPILVQHTLRVQ
jgi:uncharacterized repeat protein (TIGR01451 family)